MAMPSVARRMLPPALLVSRSSSSSSGSTGSETFPSKSTAQPKAEQNSGGGETLRSLHQDDRQAPLSLRYPHIRLLSGDPVVRMTDGGFRARNKLVGTSISCWRFWRSAGVDDAWPDL